MYYTCTYPSKSLVHSRSPFVVKDQEVCWCSCLIQWWYRIRDHTVAPCGLSSPQKPWTQICRQILLERGCWFPRGIAFRTSNPQDLNWIDMRLEIYCRAGNFGGEYVWYSARATAKFKSANAGAIVILTQPPKLIYHQHFRLYGSTYFDHPWCIIILYRVAYSTFSGGGGLSLTRMTMCNCHEYKSSEGGIN